MNPEWGLIFLPVILAIWYNKIQKCVPKKYTFKYTIPTFKGTSRDLINLL